MREEDGVRRRQLRGLPAIYFFPSIYPFFPTETQKTMVWNKLARTNRSNGELYLILRINVGVFFFIETQKSLVWNRLAGGKVCKDS